MKIVLFGLFIFLAFIAIQTNVHGLEDKPITLNSVLDSVESQFPLLRMEAEKLNIAKANLTTARAPFDADFSASASRQPNGYPTNERFETKLGTQIYGTGIIAGLAWDQFDGSVPSYREDELTGEDGRIKASLKIPLLRNLLTDQGRTGLALGKLNLQSAQQEYRFARMKIYIDASQAYYDWIARIERLKVSRTLLDLALQQKNFIKKRVTAGDLPAVDSYEIENIILEREKVFLQDQLEEQRASNKLSLFLRDVDGTAIQPSSDRAKKIVFETIPEPQVDLISWNVDDFPLIKSLSYQIDASQTNLRFQKQTRLPELNFIFEESRYQGDLPINRAEQRESYFGLSFTFPLLNFEARGQAQKAKAEVQSRTQDLVFVRDQLRVRIKNLIKELQTAHRVYNNNIQQVRNANVLSQAARKKYEAGSENLFIVNTRENQAATAQNNAIRSYFEFENIKNEVLILKNKWILQF